MGGVYIGPSKIFIKIILKFRFEKICKHPINFAISLFRSLRNHQFVENCYAKFL
jgi:hypothetical protein